MYNGLMGRNCRKCGKYIPVRMVINGQSKSLQNRKFCLDCSPYGSHNTRSDDPAIQPVKISRYKKWTNEQKRLHSARVYKRGLERKAKLIEMAGGRCKMCGYNKCQRALTFHHIDSSMKEFGLSLQNLWSISWERILIEFQKCELLCIRCHMEIEDQLSKVNVNNYKSIIDNIL